jgi:FMNH2-dependent dimethyl sulfone monooxygenase
VIKYSQDLKTGLHHQAPSFAFGVYIPLNALVRPSCIVQLDLMAPLKFAYWWVMLSRAGSWQSRVPNVSGGLVVSKIPQRTSHSLEYNVRLAQIAEESGFEFALTQIRFLAGYGAEEQHEVSLASNRSWTHQSVSFSHAILAKTERLQVIAAILPGPWNPTIAAKTLAGISLYTNGRIAVNVVSGWFKQEFISIGEPWLEVSLFSG